LSGFIPIFIGIPRSPNERRDENERKYYILMSALNGLDTRQMTSQIDLQSFIS